jgi:hypothetical protein
MANDCTHTYTLVENMVKKNRSCLSIAGFFYHLDLNSLNNYKFDS